MKAVKINGRTSRAKLSAALAAALALAGCSSADKDQVGKPNADGLISFKVAGSEGISSATPLFVAMQLGYFKQAGLDVTYTSLSSGATAMAAAMKTGAINVGLGSATQWIGDTARGALKGKLVGEFTDNNYVILGGNGIHDVRQLKGKSFAISSQNAGDHLYSKTVLSHLGVDPDTVTWLQMGEPSARLTALTSGRIDATEMPLTALPPSARDRVLVSVEASPVPFVSNAIYVSQPLLDANKGAVTKFLAAIGKASDWIRAHPDQAIKACQQSGSTAKACEGTISTALTSKSPYTWSSTTRVNVEGIKTMLPIIGTTVPQAKTMKIEDIVDPSVAPAAH